MTSKPESPRLTREGSEIKPLHRLTCQDVSRAHLIELAHFDCTGRFLRQASSREVLERLREHLRGCPCCRRWYENAHQVVGSQAASEPLEEPETLEVRPETTTRVAPSPVPGESPDTLSVAPHSPDGSSGASQDDRPRLYSGVKTPQPKAQQPGESAMSVPHPSERPTEEHKSSGSGQTPAQIGRYQVLGQLGAGGMGRVYLAWDSGLQQQVVVKMPRLGESRSAQDKDTFLRRFQCEARALAHLRGMPHIYQIYDIGEQEGCPYMVLQYVAGQSLERQLATLQLQDIERTVELACQVARIVADVHKKGILHRDLKPSNILLDTTGQPVLIDFGVAWITDDSESPTAPGVGVGALGYMAPEQAVGARDRLGPWTDVYGLGAVLYKMLTREVPFEVVAGPEQTPLPPSHFLPNLDRSLEAIVLKALAYSPQERYASADAFADALGHWLHTAKQRASRHIPVHRARLPRTGEYLVGREAELQRLDQAWEHPGERLLSIVGVGGSGKTSLVKHWLNLVDQQNWRGAKQVFCWSFSRQVTGDEAPTVDQFIDRALRTFGDPNPSAGLPRDRAERLAKLIQRQRTLLVLDGLDVLQHPPGPDHGSFTDEAMAALVESLAVDNPGLCVITTRQPVAELVDYKEHSSGQLDLRPLSPRAGADLLKRLRVWGPEEEIRQAVQEARGHALALTLLGRYLYKVCGGDVRRRTEVHFSEADHLEEGGQVRRMMFAYQKWFGDRPEWAILRLLGFFDGPADTRSLMALRAPAIANLTDSLENLSNTAWQFAVANLRECGLVEPDDPGRPHTLETHPLVREYFALQLRKEFSEIWREGHHRLYEHLKNRASPSPRTLDEMIPLYRAVAHACEAGRHEAALKEVYWPLIQQKNRAFSHRELGVYGEELALLSRFLDDSFCHAVPGISAAWGAVLPGLAGNRLCALGRLREAIRPIQVSLEAHLQREMWKYAAWAARHLSELLTALGDLQPAEAYALQALELANKSRDPHQMRVERTVLADVLHQLGRTEEAHRLFEEAERMQQRQNPKLDVLYTTWGFRYCELLLEEGATQVVQERARRMVELGQFVRPTSQEALQEIEKYDPEFGTGIIAIALAHLSLVRAQLQAAQNSRSGAGHLAQAVHKAVQELRDARRQQFVPFGLLTRAVFHRYVGEWKAAEEDLGELMAITSRSSMKLHQADCLLEYSRLYHARYLHEKTFVHLERAREHLVGARELIQQMNYHRRDREVRELEGLLEAPARPGEFNQES